VKRFSGAAIGLFFICGIAITLLQFQSKLLPISVAGTISLLIGMYMYVSNSKEEKMVQIIMSLNQSSEEERKAFLKKISTKRKSSFISRFIIFILLIIIIILIGLGVVIMFDIQPSGRVLELVKKYFGK
jgi:hypothetical protein